MPVISMDLPVGGNVTFVGPSPKFDGPDREWPCPNCGRTQQSGPWCQKCEYTGEWLGLDSELIAQCDSCSKESRRHIVPGVKCGSCGWESPERKAKSEEGFKKYQLILDKLYGDWRNMTLEQINKIEQDRVDQGCCMFCAKPLPVLEDNEAEKAFLAGSALGEDPGIDGLEGIRWWRGSFCRAACSTLQMQFYCDREGK